MSDVYRAGVKVLCLQVRFSLNSFSSNCWIRRPSMAPFSMSCYTTAALLPPILLSGDCGGCGTALLPWQQALSHSPHITRAVWPPPPPPPYRRARRAEPGQSRCILPPALIPAALSIPTPTPHFLFNNGTIFHHRLLHLSENIP